MFDDMVENINRHPSLSVDNAEYLIDDVRDLFLFDSEGFAIQGYVDNCTVTSRGVCDDTLLGYSD